MAVAPYEHMCVCHVCLCHMCLCPRVWCAPAAVAPHGPLLLRTSATLPAAALGISTGVAAVRPRPVPAAPEGADLTAAVGVLNRDCGPVPAALEPELVVKPRGRGPEPRPPPDLHTTTIRGDQGRLCRKIVHVSIGLITSRRHRPLQLLAAAAGVLHRDCSCEPATGTHSCGRESP